MNQKKVAVGLSGGVDSAVSALLLKRAGFNVVGVHLYCWPPKSEIEKDLPAGRQVDASTREEWIKKNGCRADEDRAMALKTALELEIPFKVLDFSEEYNQRVIKYFFDEYEAGRTPNPDVMCNSEIKFGLFLEWALENGFDYIATGHYAKISSEPAANTTLSADEIILPAQNFSGTQGADPAYGVDHAQRTLRNPAEKGIGYGSIKLYIPADKHKDQTYFLWKLTQKELSHVLFPLGDLKKDEVRIIAADAGLTVATKKDSQGICFVGNVEAREFLSRRLKEKPGKVMDTKGNVIGKHDGVWFYTVGQRGGWELDPEAQHEFVKNEKTPILYVVSKNAKENTLVVGEADEAMGDQFEVWEVNKISDTKWELDDLVVRIRHGGELIGARGMETKEGLVVVLDKAMRGIASGQSAVFYSHEGECLGGGVIE